tara:strand:+ start:1192 stop:1539 length:348 start_codon:yes stop_codon:yes gene_type:complete
MNPNKILIGARPTPIMMCVARSITKPPLAIINGPSPMGDHNISYPPKHPLLLPTAQRVVSRYDFDNFIHGIIAPIDNLGDLPKHPLLLPTAQGVGVVDYFIYSGDNVVHGILLNY